MENLCFILEAMQFKQQFIPNLDTLLKDRYKYEDDTVGWIIKLPNSLPSSSIVEKQDNYEEQIILLYNKYIKSDADLSINISYDTRKNFMSDKSQVIGHGKNRYDNDGNGLVQSNGKEHNEKEKYVEIRDKMLKIFDGALCDIDSNLAASFIRFKMYGTLEVDVKQDIMDVMVEQSKEGKIK